MKKKMIWAIALMVSILLCGCSLNEIQEMAIKEPDERVPIDAMWQIGIMLDKTSEDSLYGESTAKGIQMAVDEINETGGIGGHQVTSLVMNDEGNATRAKNVYETLKDWGMDVLIGTNTDITTAHIAGKTDDDKLLMLTPAVIDMDAFEKHESLYGVFLSEETLGQEVGDYVGANGIGTKVGIICERFNSEMKYVCESFAYQVQKYDIDVVAIEQFLPEPDVDLTEMLNSMESEGVDMIFMPLDEDGCNAVFKGAAEIDYDPIFVGLKELGDLVEDDSEDMIKAHRIYSLSEGNPKDTSVDKLIFSKKYYSKYNEEADEGSMAGYESIYILKEAIEEANLLPGENHEENYEKLKAEFEKMTYSGLIGENTKWNSEGLATKELFARTFIQAD